LSYFPPAQIQGVTYELDHLEPFFYEVGLGESKHTLYIVFGCHCFTRKLDYSRPYSEYQDGFELRSFCEERYRLSKGLPDIIRELKDGYVYRSPRDTYFAVRNGLSDEHSAPYVVYFDIDRARRDDADVYIKVHSAYFDPDLMGRAERISFIKLIESVSREQPLPPLHWAPIN
jgi:hypothetical protein